MHSQVRAVRSGIKDAWYMDPIVSGADNQYAVDREIGFLNRTATSDFTGYTAVATVAGGHK